MPVKSLDVKVKKIPVQLDKERHLVFDLNAFCELEDKYGSQEEALNALGSGSFKAIRTFLWAGLVHEDESLTEKEVGKMIDIANISELANAITEAVNNALPEPKN
ncbi:hypothetical protein [Thermaerobacillus caldiproteolyticus]|uniref:hypothetical protein n=1 Tax=Thermaerobacillus caldiproteolyticus TaxID=247480 RepID=UPI00188B3AD6|nr:hypothetical protein [Anoxybacillus caldiproteolyticus]QPA31628.1 hypothetical protein ISX45_00980 [Anoxybacillus caldiproteolyticus]